MTVLRVILMSTCFLAAGLTFGASGDGWKTFKSEKHRFSVRYPASWHTLNHTIKHLDIINFPHSKRVRGIFLPDGGANIVVVPSTGVPSGEGITTLSEWIAKDLSHYTVLGKREIVPLSGELGACTQLIEVENEFEEGPDRYTHGTSYYCAIQRGFFRIGLSHWRGDPNHEQLKEIALKIALSLRSW